MFKHSALCSKSTRPDHTLDLVRVFDGGFDLSNAGIITLMPNIGLFWDSIQNDALRHRRDGSPQGRDHFWARFTTARLARASNQNQRQQRKSMWKKRRPPKATQPNLDALAKMHDKVHRAALTYARYQALTDERNIDRNAVQAKLDGLIDELHNDDIWNAREVAENRNVLAIRAASCGTISRYARSNATGDGTSCP